MKTLLLFGAIALTLNSFGQVPTYVPTNGLVAWWGFNGNANDESVNTNDGTVNGATLTTDRFGVPNSAYYFSSTSCGTRIDASVNTASILTGLTISVWVMRVGNGCEGPRLFEFWPGADGPGSAQWGWDNSNVAIGVGSITSTGFICSAGLPVSPNNVWTNIVYTNDGVNGCFYKDGVLETVVPSTGNPILAGALALGRMNHPVYDAFNGNLDDFGIWNRALSSCEVQELFQAQLITPLSGTDIQAACDSYTWIDGNTYTSANNTATWMETSTTGCDSLVTLDLTITNSNTGTDVQTACNTFDWIDGNTYTSDNNTATWLETNATGCDSLVTLDLTITNSNTGADIQTACNTFAWIDGNTYTSDNNSATWTETNAAGCDSVVTLDLTVTYSNTGTDTQTACGTYDWIDGNTYTADNNTATWTETNAAGCDSLVTLDLTITPLPDNNVTQSGSQLTANQAGATYQWLDCANSYAVIAAETNQLYTPSISGNYAVEVILNGCADTSACYLVDVCTTNPITTQPTDQTVNIGNNASIDFSDSLTAATYQWQMDAGTGYSDLSNAGQFSGADTQTLTISSTSMGNNNTLYRCVVTESASCSDTTDVSTLTVIDNPSPDCIGDLNGDGFVTLSDLTILLTVYGSVCD